MSRTGEFSAIFEALDRIQYTVTFYLDTVFRAAMGRAPLVAIGPAAPSSQLCMPALSAESLQIDAVDDAIESFTRKSSLSLALEHWERGQFRKRSESGGLDPMSIYVWAEFAKAHVSRLAPDSGRSANLYLNIAASRDAIIAFDGATIVNRSHVSGSFNAIDEWPRRRPSLLTPDTNEIPKLVDLGKERDWELIRPRIGALGKTIDLPRPSNLAVKTLFGFAPPQWELVKEAASEVETISTPDAVNVFGNLFDFEPLSPLRAMRKYYPFGAIGSKPNTFPFAINPERIAGSTLSAYASLKPTTDPVAVDKKLDLDLTSNTYQPRDWIRRDFDPLSLFSSASKPAAPKTGQRKKAEQKFELQSSEPNTDPAAADKKLDLDLLPDWIRRDFDPLSLFSSASKPAAPKTGQRKKAEQKFELQSSEPNTDPAAADKKLDFDLLPDWIRRDFDRLSLFSPGNKSAAPKTEQREKAEQKLEVQSFRARYKFPPVGIRPTWEPPEESDSLFEFLAKPLKSRIT
jgi:hypothetical protein